MIDDKAWKDLQNEYCTELKSQTKPFVSLESLANVCKLVLMASGHILLVWLRHDMFKKQPSTSHPLRSSPRGAARAPNQDGHRGDDDIMPLPIQVHSVLAPRPGEGWKPPPPMMAASPSTRPTPPPSTPPLTTPPMAVAP